MVGGGREGSGGDSVVGMECVRVGVCESGDDRVDGGVVDEERWIGGAWGGWWRTLVIVTSASTSRR